MRRVLIAILVLFGVVVIAIACAHIALGPSSIPGSVPVNATMDSEDRFYATLFLGFGVTLIWAARDIDRRAGAVKALMAVFFAGGVARIISALAVGPPSLLFTMLGGVELVLPLIIWAMLKRIAPAQ